MTSSRVSVILPAYNVETYVAQTVASLIEQDWADLELIAIDDGSSDSTLAILEELVRTFQLSGPQRRAILISQTNRGAGAARNVGLENSTGEKILFCDADDLLMPTAVRELSSLLENDNSLDLVFPLCQHIDAQGNNLNVGSKPVKGALHVRDLIENNPIHSGTGVLLRKSATQRAGSFDPTLKACIDLDFWVRACADIGPSILSTNTVLVKYRRRPLQITASWQRQKEGWSSVAEKSLERGLLSRSSLEKARGINSVVWATTAYQAADYKSARKLIFQAFLLAPVKSILSSSAQIRLLACVASLLPARIHSWISASVNKRFSG